MSSWLFTENHPSLGCIQDLWANEFSTNITWVLQFLSYIYSHPPPTQKNNPSSVGTTSIAYSPYPKRSPKSSSSNSFLKI